MISFSNLGSSYHESMITIYLRFFFLQKRKKEKRRRTELKITSLFEIDSTFYNISLLEKTHFMAFEKCHGKSFMSWFNYNEHFSYQCHYLSSKSMAFRKHHGKMIQWRLEILWKIFWDQTVSIFISFASIFMAIEKTSWVLFLWRLTNCHNIYGVKKTSSFYNFLMMFDKCREVIRIIKYFFIWCI